MRERVARVATVVLAVALVPCLQQTASAAIAGEPQVIASDLQWPWEVVLVPDGRILVTERPGRIRVIEADGDLQAAPAYESLGGQFLGLALHPSYASNRFVYLYNTYPVVGGWRNRIQRFVDNGTTLTFSATILDQIPGENNHDGGRIKFGPDGKLYATTGDVHDPSTPQDLESLAGKILRLNAPGDAQDGTAPADNPFPGGTNSKFVWSYGHRHPQGLDWDGAGRLWATEHGPSGESYAGGRCCRDELNLIEAGGNYGWPVIMGDEQQAGMRSPVVSSGDTVVWAPSGATFAPDGHIYFSNLLGEHLRELTIAGTQVTEQREHFRGRFGRLRAAVYGSGFLYLTTSNNSSDEKVLRVPVTAGIGSPPQAPPVSLQADTRRPSVRLGFRARQSLRRAIARGISGWVRCDEACVVTGELVVSRGVARRLRLTARGRPVVVALGRRRLRQAGRARLRLSLKRRARRRLRRVRRLTTTLRVRATDAAGNTTRVVKKVTFRR